MTQARRITKFLWDNGKFYGRGQINLKRKLRRPMETENAKNADR